MFKLYTCIYVPTGKRRQRAVWPEVGSWECYCLVTQFSSFDIEVFLRTSFNLVIKISSVCSQLFLKNTEVRLFKIIAVLKMMEETVTFYFYFCNCINQSSRSSNVLALLCCCMNVLYVIEISLLVHRAKSSSPLKLACLQIPYNEGLFFLCFASQWLLC